MTQEEENLYQLAREIAERNTSMPAYLCDDEAWYAAVDEARAEMGITEKAPVCVYCGDVAPYGDARNNWISYHHSFLHKLYHTKIQKIFIRKDRKPR